MTHDFMPKLGRIGWKNGTRLDRYINCVMRAAHAAGHVANRGRGGFTGSHIGRGGAFGTLAGADLYPGGQRRAIVKVRITKLKRGNLGAARAVEKVGLGRPPPEFRCGTDRSKPLGPD